MSLLLYIFLVIIGHALAFHKVRVSEGILEGTTFVTEEGKTAYKFLGIPFASPPIGNLRFKAPQPPSRWNGIREAKELRNICKCYPYRNETTDEDCLYLDIYTPNLGRPNGERLPVMVFISGGGFQLSIRDAPSDWIVMENVVLVSIMYRVGVFGFLSLDTEEVPGNAGLKDQVAALKWIQRNIAAFGGDPDNITIFGQSAGGASINFHLVSDMSKGLFHKAVMMSGCALSPWAYVVDHKQFGTKLSSKLGCQTENKSDEMLCLLSKSSYELLEVVGKPPSTAIAEENMYLQELVFLPSIEKKFHGQEAFLTESPHHRMKIGKFHNLPIMAGYTDAEAVMKVNDAAKNPVLLGMIDIHFQRYIPRELRLRNRSKLASSIADQIKTFYYGEEPIKENEENFIKIKSDSLYKRGINEVVRLLADKSHEPVYFYRFSFYDPDLRNATGLISYEGASHVDDLYFLLIDSNVLPRYKPQVERTRRRMVKLYTNFAKYGNPTPQNTELIPLIWEPVTKTELNYLSIDKELRLSTNPDEKSIQFWKNIEKNTQRKY